MGSPGLPAVGFLFLLVVIVGISTFYRTEYTGSIPVVVKTIHDAVTA